MKKILIFIMVSFICKAIFSQEPEKKTQEQTNEIKINIMNTIIFAYPEVNFERVFSDEFGVGLSAAATFLDNKIETIDLIWHIMPYGRIYFNSNNFFLESNMTILSYKDTSTEINTSFGIGVAVGCKFIFKNIVSDSFVGVGRVLGEYEHFYPRCGVTIGFVF